MPFKSAKMPTVKSAKIGIYVQDFQKLKTYITHSSSYKCKIKNLVL